MAKTKKDPIGERLRKAAGDGDEDLCAALLAAGAKPSATDPAGEGPLHRAAGAGMDKTLALLLAAGADFNARGAFGETPMHRAAERLAARCVSLLAAAGADAAAPSDNPIGNTPAHIAAMCPVGNPMPTIEAIAAAAPPGWESILNRAGETPAEAAALPAVKAMIEGVVEARRELRALESEIPPKEVGGRPPARRRL